MAGKSKFQLLRLLDDRITKLFTCVEECDQEFANVEKAFVLGFHYSNVTNFVGLTTDYKLHNATSPVVGLVYFKAIPTQQQIIDDLQPVKEHFYSSSDGFGSQAKSDKNEHLFIVITVSDEDGAKVSKKIFDSNLNCFVEPQPKLSVLDRSKIYAHSAVCKLEFCLKLKVLEDNNKLLPRDKLEAELESAKKLLANFPQGLSLQLASSSFSSKCPLENKSPLESLYASLDVPKEVEQAGDYLPQMSKEDKKKLRDKWHNKMRDQRAPLSFQLDLEGLTIPSDNQERPPKEVCQVSFPSEFMHLQVSDSISKCAKIMLFSLRLKLELIKRILLPRAGGHLDPDELKTCTFLPPSLGHFLSTIYAIPTETTPDFEQLRDNRRELHHAYIIPFDKPAVRYSQRVTNHESKSPDEEIGYLCNVHSDILEKSGIKGGTRSVLEGTYTYHHYLQDRVQDSGWGCAYRSLQTIVSWFKHQAYIYSPDIEARAPKSAASSGDKTSQLRHQLSKEARVPTHQEIQSVLVDVGDKQSSFIGSEKWIGSQEVCYVLNHLYDLDSKFISVSSGDELVYKARELGQHFATHSTPVMIGGGVLAHTIIGIDFNEKNGDISYLILDPHYTGPEDVGSITKKGWCGWKRNSFWDKGAFYNLCLPQRPREI